MSRPPKPRLETMRRQLAILKEIGAGPRAVEVAEEAIKRLYPLGHEFLYHDIPADMVPCWYPDCRDKCHFGLRTPSYCGKNDTDHETLAPRPKVSRWTWAWIAWLAIFLCIEIPAAIKRKGATLSEHVWKWFGIRTKDKGYRLKRLILAGFLLALSSHLVFDTSSIPVAVGGAAILAVIGVSLRREGVVDAVDDVPTSKPVLGSSAGPCESSPPGDAEAPPGPGVHRS